MGQSSQIPGGPGRREAERFNVQLNVLLPDGSGTTRNASSKGVYFVTDRPMAPGSPITFTLVFELDETETMHLRCEGEIVRVEETGGRTGVAAKILSSSFQRPDGSPPDFRSARSGHDPAHLPCRTLRIDLAQPEPSGLDVESRQVRRDHPLQTVGLHA